MRGLSTEIQSTRFQVTLITGLECTLRHRGTTANAQRGIAFAGQAIHYQRHQSSHNTNWARVTGIRFDAD